MQGEVLSVTPVYAEYYQAIVHYRYILQLSDFDLTGTLTIFPREKR